MNPILSFNLIVLVAVLTLAETGCAKKKEVTVDVQAQIQALAGDQDAKLNALVELSKSGPGALPALDKVVALLSEDDPLIRRTAAYAIETMGPVAKSAIPALEKSMDGATVDVVMAATRAINALDPNHAK